MYIFYKKLFYVFNAPNYVLFTLFFMYKSLPGPDLRIFVYPETQVGIISSCMRTRNALPAANTTSQPVNLSKKVSCVVFTTRELGASRNFPICDLHLY